MNKFRVGDTVRVRKPAEVKEEPRWLDEMDKFDGTFQEIREVRSQARIVRFVGDRHWWSFHFDWLEPVRSWVPSGYSVIDMAVPDEMASQIGDGNALVWKKPNRGQRYFVLGLTTNVSRADFLDNFYPVIVPTSPPPPQYRDPTQGDIGKMVEVRNSEKDEWIERELLAVISDPEILCKFVCRNLASRFIALAWPQAKIKID